MVLVVAVVAVAYGAQAPQLGVAELAPAARQAAEPPPTTSGPLDAATGGRGAARRPTTTTAPLATSSSSATSGAGAAPTTVVGRARQCFGSPPRQLPDPRSPACMAAVFEGDNAGATSAGVTATEVRVALLGSTPDPAFDALFEYFNHYFEFYGRRLVPVYVPQGAAGTITEQRAVAETIGAAGVFAMLGASRNYWFPSFYNELARQRVISVLSGTYDLPSDRDLFDAAHPFVWSVQPSIEQIWRNLSDLVCTTLAGRPAAHAGPALVTTTRTFGVVVSGNNRLPWVRPLLDGLAACDVVPRVVELQNNGDASWTTSARTALQRLRADGVTTLICACSENRAISVVGQMSGAGVEDVEWLLPTFTAHLFEEFYLQNSWPEQLRGRVFGLQPLAPVAEAQALWGLHAAREINPKVERGDGDLLVMYDRLLVLAAGIQAAGPALTPDTFGQGLMSAQFDNSDTARAPYWLPSVGFGPGDHSFYNDYALAWWSATATPLGSLVTAGRGSWCYLDRGARYAAGRFPADADSRFFNPNEPCR